MAEIYVLFLHTGKYSDKAVSLCGVFSSREAADAHRHEIMDASQRRRGGDVARLDDFVLLRTAVDHGVQVSTEYSKDDLYDDERQRRHAEAVRLSQERHLADLARAEQNRRRRSMFDDILQQQADFNPCDLRK